MAELKDHCEAAFQLFQQGGGIPAADFGNALRAVGTTPSEEDIAELLDGAASADLAKFVESAEAVEKVDKEMCSESFSVFDTNSNGYISLPELTHLMKNLGEGLSEDQLAGMSTAAAADSDGQVNIRAFVDVLFSE